MAGSAGSITDKRNFTTRRTVAAMISSIHLSKLGRFLMHSNTDVKVVVATDVAVVLSSLERY